MFKFWNYVLVCNVKYFERTSNRIKMYELPKCVQ